jgi:hypothetical protein
MAKPGHDIIVKVGLTADQYLELQRIAESEDVSQSSFMRSLLVAAIRLDALKRIPKHLLEEGQE